MLKRNQRGKTNPKESDRGGCVNVLKIVVQLQGSFSRTVSAICFCFNILF